MDKEIKTATDLDELLAAVTAFTAIEVQDDEAEAKDEMVDWDILPSFGDDYTGDDTDVMSVDEARMLRFCAGEWAIDDRDDMTPEQITKKNRMER